MATTTTEELARSIQNDEDYIEIEGNLSEKVIKIKSQGKVAWLIALGALIIALVLIKAMVVSSVSGPVIPTVELFLASSSATGSVLILGWSTTIMAISMVWAVKDRSVLSKLRNNYSIIEKSQHRIVLKRK